MTTPAPEPVQVGSLLFDPLPDGMLVPGGLMMVTGVLPDGRSTTAYRHVNLNTMEIVGVLRILEAQLVAQAVGGMDDE